MREEKILKPLSRAGNAYWSALFLLAGFAGIGFWQWLIQLNKGLSVTGMNNSAYLGIYIVNYSFFIGLSAGGILIASIVYAYGIEKFRPVARIAEVFAIGCLVMAMLAIVFDLGRPDRMFNIFIYARFNSPLIWDVAIINIYLLIAIAMGYLCTRQDIVRCMNYFPKRRRFYRLLALGYLDVSDRALNRDRKILRILSLISIPGTVLLISISAWIFGLIKAVPGWHTAILAPVFIGSALVSGLGWLIVVTLMIRKFLGYQIKDDIIWELGRVLWYLIPLLGYLLFSEFITVMYARELSAEGFFKELILGVFAPLFWFNLVGGIIIPFGLLLFFPQNIKAIFSAAMLAVVGVFLERTDIILLPMVYKSLMPYPPGIYAPTGAEIVIMAGFYSLGFFVMLVLAKIFPLAEVETLETS